MSILENEFRPIIVDRVGELEYLSKDFVGREWLFQEIDNWINYGDEQIFFLVGEPGSGKSAISSQLIQKQKHIIAHHFYVPYDSSRIVPSMVLRLIASQLISRFPYYRRELGFGSSNSPLPTIVIDEFKVTMKPFDFIDLNSTFYSVRVEDYYEGKPEEIINDIIKPFSELQTPIQPAIVLIDAVNVPISYTCGDGRDALYWILEALSVLPSWIRYVFTTRPDQKILKAFKDFKIFNYYLDTKGKDNLQDVRIYLCQRISDNKIRQQLAGLNINLQAITAQIEERFNGNFLIIKTWFDSIESEEMLSDEFVLGKLYQKLLQEFFLKQIDWEKKGKPLMGILAVIKEPIMEAQLLDFVNVDKDVVQGVLSKIRQFLNVVENNCGNETFALFQESLGEYLIDKEINRYFWCDAKEHHNKIVDYYFSQIF